MRTIDKINKLNKYRPWFWLAGLAGAIILSRFVSKESFDSIEISANIQVAFAIISVLGMIALVYLGYVLGRKIDSH